MYTNEIAQFLKTGKNPLIVVLGPTASGKTALAVKLAKNFNGEIISTDSRQIYKYMNIATDAVRVEEQEGIPHHLLQFAEPDEVISLAEFKDMALEKIADIEKRGKIPILAGGTGLYISAITEGYNVPRIKPNEKLRAKLEREAREKGSEFLHNKLKKLDPGAAVKIHPNNLRYVIRALEINRQSGAPKTDLKNKSPFTIFKIGIEWPRAELYKRVELRVDKQIERGLVAEVQNLLEKKYEPNLPSMSSIGVKEIIPYLKGEMSLEECVNILKKNTRNYAKRQMTWFRKYDNVSWLTANDVQKNF